MMLTNHGFTFIQDSIEIDELLDTCFKMLTQTMAYNSQPQIKMNDVLDEIDLHHGLLKPLWHMYLAIHWY